MPFYPQLNLFGEADPAWVREKVTANVGHRDIMSAVCNDMLENGFTKVGKKEEKTPPKVSKHYVYLPTTPFFQESLLFSGYLDPKNRSTPIFHIFRRRKKSHLISL